jgi:hypothetical protein
VWCADVDGGKPGGVRTQTLVAALALVAPVLALAGEPVLLPDFTPASTSDFSLAALLHQATADRLSRSGHIVLVSDVVAPVVGPLYGCADDPSCPQAQLAKLPARFAVVVGVRRDGAKIVADVALYEQSSQAPIERRTVEIVDGREDELGREVADLVHELAGVMGPADASAVIAAAKLISDAEGRDGSTAGTPGGEPAPQRDRPVKPEPLSDDARIEQALADTDFTERHLVGVRDHFLNSGLDIRDWAYRATPHAGRTIIEVRGAYGFGDTDRVAYVRTSVGADGEQAQWFQEGPAEGQRVRGELFVGYAPSAWVDVGALLGLQYGERTLDSAWSDTQGGGRRSTDTVQAVQFHLQPRVRLYPVRTGPFKPYIFAGVDLRFFDQWRIREVNNIRYAQPPGGMAAGPVGGGGLLIDPSPLVGFFAEASYAVHYGARAGYAQNSSALRPADTSFVDRVPAGYLVVVSGGVQFRL